LDEDEDDDDILADEEDDDEDDDDDELDLEALMKAQKRKATPEVPSKAV